MRKTWTIEQRVRGQNQRAKQAGARHDLTVKEWLETLEFFNHKCAYCGEREYEFIEHYLPVQNAGTTASNCVPACASCNALKDSKNHTLSMYQNQRVINFLESKGAKIGFYIHNFSAIKGEHVILRCDSCGIQMDTPGLAIEDAQAYIDQFLKNTGYAYLK